MDRERIRDTPPLLTLGRGMDKWDGEEKRITFFNIHNNSKKKGKKKLPAKKTLIKWHKGEKVYFCYLVAESDADTKSKEGGSSFKIRQGREKDRASQK